MTGPKITPRHWETPGDTYERYTSRMQKLGLPARPFKEWLEFELALEAIRHGGRQPRLEDSDLGFERNRLTAIGAIPIDEDRPRV